ncbi:MAG: dehydrogenase [Desulfurococcaceae archaeon]|jgi:nitrate reductase beta subunit|nr:MAG: dehydrogenase [Desulfurococcaceae archaeon]
MPRVYNWQIGREMDYPYPAARPKRQAAGIFNLNKCIGCQTCTVACKTTWTSGRGQEYMLWNNVEDKPWGSYPLRWDVKILSMLAKLEPIRWKKEGGTWVYRGKTIFEAAPPGEIALGYMPESYDYAFPAIGEGEASTSLRLGSYRAPFDPWFFFLPRICNHCTFPSCLAACPRQAIYKRDDGVVLVDQFRCRGYRECVKSCPYKKVFYNPVTRVSEKCIFCYPALEKGEIPRCFRNCIGKIRMFGYISLPEKADPENPIDFLVHIKRIAAPLLPQLGLEPNIYYIPPINIKNMDFVRMMFGPMGEEAVNNYVRAIEKQDIEVIGALILSNSTDRIIHRFKVIGGEYVAGYNEKGNEVIRVPITEQVVVRPYYDEKLGVYRRNDV